MKFTAIMTHNPQDFFEGAEPEDLQIRIDFDFESWPEKIPVILGLVSGGYKAILFPGGDDREAADGRRVRDG